MCLYFIDPYCHTVKLYLPNSKLNYLKAGFLFGFKTGWVCPKLVNIYPQKMAVVFELHHTG